MRVCFFHEGAAWSGSARAFADAARELGARGHEVTMACAPGTAVERQWAVSGLTVLPVDPRGAWLRAGWRLRAFLQRHFVEVVFVHSEREQLVASAAVRLAGRGAVVRRVPPHGRLTLGGDARLAMRLAATGFLFAFPDDLRAARPPSRALRPVVAPPGVSVPADVSLESAEHDATVRTIACLYDAPHHARVSGALRTTALLAARHPELRLALLGPLGDDDSLRIQAAALGIGGIISLAVQLSERAHALAGASVAWVIADGDDAVYALLDAFIAGVPVVVDRDPLSVRFVSDGENGALTAPFDPAVHAAVIAALLADDGRRARLVRGAREALARWPLNAMAEGFELAAAVARDRTRWRV